MSSPSRLVCSGCGYEVPPTAPAPFRCPRAGAEDDIDHVLRRVLEPGSFQVDGAVEDIFQGAEDNPFVQYRQLFHSHAVGVSSGLDDLAFAVLVEELDAAVARIAGTGFTRTPFVQIADLAHAIGIEPDCLWIKDETGNVSGSHKGRHLMGLMLWMEMARRVFPTAPDPARQLAIASCGNAALAAAVVARAANRALDVFVPTSADSSVIDSLHDLRARVVTCPRDETLAGDPCFHGFREAIEEGALPFTCQGSENGLVIEGGKTLVWEMVSDLVREGRRIDNLIVQVGGGALGSACIQGLKEARDLGVLDRLPVIHTVQTAGVSPLHRAWDTIMDKILLRHQGETGQAAPLLSGDLERAQFVREEVLPLLVRDELHSAATHRSEFMWAWEEEPRSIATAILDDETYDWLSLVEGMLTTGGIPLVVSEDSLAEAHHLVREHTEIPADPTGTAGLAGLVELNQREMLPKDEVSAVLFTGVER